MNYLFPLIYVACFLLILILAWGVPAFPLFQMRSLLEAGTARVTRSLPPALEGHYHQREVRLTNDAGTRREPASFNVALQCRCPRRIVLKRKPRVISLGLHLARGLGLAKPPAKSDTDLYNLETNRDRWSTQWLARPEVQARIAALISHRGARRIDQTGAGYIAVTCAYFFPSWTAEARAKAILDDLTALALSLEQED